MIRIYLFLSLVVFLFIFYRAGIYFSIPFYKVNKLYVNQADVCGFVSDSQLKMGQLALEFAVKLDSDFFLEQITLSCCQFQPGFQPGEIYPHANTFYMVLGRVIMIPPGRFPRELVIGVGKEHGVKRYSLVLKDGVLFGRVIDVSAQESRVLTIFSDDFFVDLFFPSIGARGIVRGSEDGKLEIVTGFGRTSDFREGEIVVTAGSRYSSPFGIKSGIVDKEGNLKALTSPDNLLYVVVVVTQ